MKNAKLELLKKLSKYSKEDIIEALGRQCQADFIIRGILNDLEYIASKECLMITIRLLKNIRTLLKRI